ncbi:hypothetical protein BDV95DRAFT_663218 [Massariosphaeria phaeospora]|uniref:Uncharacterized protein n=1 Tax=Massariosphaeria phaeospora TaxID=100035 RepID=A0A7C8IEY6_9PLEO|nr:hypothetical protein BDV95DRAFT_663218 [Massariosphaeria phaeospora]
MPVTNKSYVGRLGKPKGSKNKKTLEKERLSTMAPLSGSMTPQSRGRRSEAGDPPPLGDDLGNDGLVASPSFSPNATNNAFVNPTLESLGMGAASQGGHVLPDAVMLEQIMLPDPPQSFLFSGFDEIAPQSPPSSSSRTRLYGDGSEENIMNSFIEFKDTSDIDMRGLLSPPPSLQSSHNRRSRPRDHEIALTGSHDYQSRRLSVSNDQCHCLQVHADLLCTLRQAGAKMERLDNLLRITDSAYPTLRASLQCSQCLHDGQVMQLCSMALKTLVGAIGTSFAPDIQVDARIGDHVLQQEDSAWVGSLLLTRNLSRFKSIVTIFKRRLDRSRIAGKCDRQEEEYMGQVVQAIDKSVDRISNHIRGTLNGVE